MQMFVVSNVFSFRVCESVDSIVWYLLKIDLVEERSRLVVLLELMMLFICFKMWVFSRFCRRWSRYVNCLSYGWVSFFVCFGCISCRFMIRSLLYLNIVYSLQFSYELNFLFLNCCRSHWTMVKAVAVLNSSEGVKGTITFVQEADGSFNFDILFNFIYFLALFYLVQWNYWASYLILCRTNYCNWKRFWSEAWSSWIPCSCSWGYNKWLHVNWYCPLNWIWISLILVIVMR